MRAIVLAAGEGRRNRPLTHTRPKVMLPVGNLPILEHVVRALHAADVHDVTMVVGYKAEAVQRHFQDGAGFGVRIDYVHQPQPVGTADAVARGLAAQEGPGPILVVPGDNYVGRDVLKAFLSEAGDQDALLYTQRADPRPYGVIEVVDDFVTSVQEAPDQPRSDLISTGIVLLAFERAQGVKKYTKDSAGLSAFLQEVARGRGRLRAVRLGGGWFDVDRPENLLDANGLHLNGLQPDVHGTVEPGASLVGAVSVGKGSRIRSGTYIVGPVSIGEACEIGPHAVLYGPTSVGDNVTIGPFTELLECVVLGDVRIASGCTLHHVVLDRGVVLAPRVSMDKAHVVQGPGFGAVVGDGTMFGNNVVVAPGSVVGVNVRVAPHKSVGALPDGARVV